MNTEQIIKNNRLDSQWLLEQKSKWFGSNLLQDYIPVLIQSVKQIFELWSSWNCMNSDSSEFWSYAGKSWVHEQNYSKAYIVHNIQSHTEVFQQVRIILRKVWKSGGPSMYYYYLKVCTFRFWFIHDYS